MTEQMTPDLIQDVVERMTRLESEISVFFPLVRKLVSLKSVADPVQDSTTDAAMRRPSKLKAKHAKNASFNDFAGGQSTEFLRVLVQSPPSESEIEDWVARSRPNSVNNLRSSPPYSPVQHRSQQLSRRPTSTVPKVDSNTSEEKLKMGEPRDEIFERAETETKEGFMAALAKTGGALKLLKTKSRFAQPPLTCSQESSKILSESNDSRYMGVESKRMSTSREPKSELIFVEGKEHCPAPQHIAPVSITICGASTLSGDSTRNMPATNTEDPEPQTRSIALVGKGNYPESQHTNGSTPSSPKILSESNSPTRLVMSDFKEEVAPKYPTATFFRNSARFKSTLRRATIAPKYDSKGSLASERPVSLRGVNEDETPVVAEKKMFTLSQGLNAKSSFSTNAQVFVSLVMMSTIWLIPFSLAYQVKLPILYSCILSVTYLVDCILEFLTFNCFHPAMNRSKVKQTLRDWQQYYLKHCFFVDAITTLPFELIPATSDSFLPIEYLWAIRILRLYKLPLLVSTSPKYLRLLKNLQYAFSIGHSGALIFPLLMMFFLFLHIESCVIYLSGRVFDSANPHMVALQEAGVMEQYTWSMLTSVGNTFPVAYSPLAPSCRWIILAFVLVGAGMYAMIVGTLSSFAIGFDASGRLYKQKLDELRDYMQWKDLGPTTRKKILKYYDLKYNGKYFEEEALLNDLNDSLRMEIAVHNCKMLVRKVSFLNREQNDGKDELFMGRIASALRSSYFVAGDVLFIQGQMGEEMYFILSGSVNVLVNGKRVVSLTEGAFFGEVALIANIPRTATVQAATSTHLYCLSRTDFVEICEEFEDVKRRVNVIYQERMENIRREEKKRKIAAAIDIGSKIEFLNRKEGDGRDEDFFLCVADGLVFDSYSAGEVIFSQGELGEDMFFIKTGSVEILINDNRVSEVSDGAVFGEIALIAHIPRTATVRAITSCTMYKLSRSNLLKILTEFEDMQIRMEKLFTNRMGTLQRMGRPQLNPPL